MKYLFFLIGINLLYSCCIKDESPIVNAAKPEIDSTFTHISQAMELGPDEAVKLYGETTKNLFGKKDHEYVLGGPEENFDVMLNTV